MIAGNGDFEQIRLTMQVSRSFSDHTGQIDPLMPYTGNGEA